MRTEAFFDTNVLIYAIAQQDRRTSQAESLLANGGVIGVQNLNEFASVVRRKLGMSWADVHEALDAILVLCPEPVPLTFEVHRLGMHLAESQGYGIYDALVVAAALNAKCKTLYSEDLQDGQVIQRSLTIRNPFV